MLHALSDPTRLAIVWALADDAEHSCSSFNEAGGLTAATLSHHFRVLREAGVTRTRIDGNRRYMSLRRYDLHARFPGVIDAILAAEYTPSNAPQQGSPPD